MLPEPKTAIRTWAAQKGLNTNIYLVVDTHGMPLRVVVTEGTKADCTQVGQLIGGAIICW